jgi:thiol-disulfide isomerase/thioredoxin
MRSLLAVLTILAVSCGPAGGEAQDGGGLEPLTAIGAGDPLPETTMPFLDADGALETTDLRGKPAVFNFWASWCTFCVDEMPDFEEVHADVGHEVAFVGVNREDNHGKAVRLAEEPGVTYMLVVDDDGSFFRAVRARGMPTTLLVDADGTIVHRHAGPLDADGLRDLLSRHLGHPSG